MGGENKIDREKIQLTAYSRFSGCGAKLGPGLLDKVLCGLTQPKNPAVLSDFSAAEDAGVYQLDEETGLVQTVDFFPPIVDDAFTFGRIAAANSLSDIFAMGGEALTALTILCYPKDTLPLEELRAMLEGAISALAEASCSLVGGHSVEDLELKLGFSVTGRVNPRGMWRNNTPRKGDALILTKAIGTGLINTALRAELADLESISASEKQMATLNLGAKGVLEKADISACTDVTGFGLLGHAAEMIAVSGPSPSSPRGLGGETAGEEAPGLTLEVSAIPLLPGAVQYAAMGLVPEGTYRNKEFRLPFVVEPASFDPVMLDVLFDPQTSGGLLATVAEKEAASVVAALRSLGLAAAKIGEVRGTAGKITLLG